MRGGRFYNLELRWDPPGVDSLQRALEMVREQAERTPKATATEPAQWVRVIGGWSKETEWFEARHILFPDDDPRYLEDLLSGSLSAQR